jgi:4-hydroxy-tetrahydrodipicolinate synthase
MAEIKGTGVAVATPFRKDGSVDFNSLEKLINHLIEGGVQFLVALGTTGETPTLTNDEKTAIIDFFYEVNKKRVPLVIGIGGNSTNAVIKALKETNLHGAEAVLSVTPYYNKPSQEGIYQHFKEIARVSPLPVILYNVPGRTSSNISAETCLKLANEFKGQIIAVKEASGDMGQIMKILKDKPKGFEVLSGDDALTFPMICLGAKGVISVLGNAYPKEFSDMVNLTLKGDLENARELHYKMIPLIDAMFAEGNPAGLKAFLNIMGICPNNLRLPLVPASSDLYNRIKKMV